MKKIISGLITVLIFSSCSNKIYYSSNWQIKPVSIDGKLSEWSNPLRFYDQESGLNYTISNDRNNLYFCCSVSNISLQTKILRSGLEFGIDTLGKKSYSVGIKYPAGNSTVPDLNGKTTQQTEPVSTARPDRSAFRLKLLAEATMIELTGFKPSVGKIITLTQPNNSGINAAIDIDKSGIMTYEAVIPFSTFYKKELIPSDSNTVFSYQIKVKPVPGATGANYSGNRRSGMGGGSGMREGGMGGGMRGGRGMRGASMRGGGGMRGGDEEMSGENRANNSQRGASMTSTTKTTIKLKLAYKK